MIFISVAAYRDPQLVPTIQDCLAKAARPEDLRFGICWQHGDEEAALPFAGDPRFRILDVDWRLSRGACWARAEVMNLYRGEAWFLQLDSHHRFARNWDERLLAQAGATGSERPVITAYATPFQPGDPDVLGDEPLQMVFDRITDEGVALFRPIVIPGWRERSRAVRARFVSAHFLFAPGSFVRDVPYDPELYFIGEEMTLAIRAFTHGYDLFHPSEVIVWHEYSRDGRPQHWGDHLKANGVELDWYDRDRVSVARIRRFLQDPKPGTFACGTVRTFADYEAHAGLTLRQYAPDSIRRFFELPGPPVPARLELEGPAQGEPGDVAGSESATAADPDRVDFWCALGRAYDEVGRQEDAGHAFERSLTLVRGRAKPIDEADGAVFASAIRWRAKRQLPVDALIAEGVRLFPDNPQLLWYDACRLMEQRSFGVALAALERVLAAGPEEQAVRTVIYDRRIFGALGHEAAAICCFKLGRYAEAGRHFGLALTDRPADVDLRRKSEMAERLAGRHRT